MKTTIVTIILFLLIHTNSYSLNDFSLSSENAFTVKIVVEKERKKNLMGEFLEIHVEITNRSPKTISFDSPYFPGTGWQINIKKDSVNYSFNDIYFFGYQRNKTIEIQAKQSKTLKLIYNIDSLQDTEGNPHTKGTYAMQIVLASQDPMNRSVKSNTTWFAIH